MQEGDVLDLLEALVGPAQLASEQGHVGRDAVGVTERVVVLGAERRAQGSQVAEVEALDLLVEFGVLERESHELAHRLGDGDLLFGELAFDVVKEVDQTDDLVARDQRQRDHAELAVAVHVLAFRFAESGVVEAACGDCVAGLQGESVEGPLVETDLVAHPGGVVDAVEGRRHADHVLSSSSR